MTLAKRHRISRIAILLALAVIYVMIAASINTKYAPDEVMRFQIPQWIFEKGTLPVGNEPELTDNAYGFSYAFRPYLASLIAVAFMKAASLFGAGGYALLIAARFVSVVSSLISVSLAFCIGDRLSGRKEGGTFLGLIIGCLPQFAFISGYFNNDAFALMTAMLILYLIIRGRDEGWPIGLVLVLGGAIGMNLLSYYNCYGWIVAAVVFCVVDCIISKKSVRFILARVLAAAGVAIVAAGWYFIRNYVIYNGDILGNKAMLDCAAAWEQAGHSINHMIQPALKGISIPAMLMDGTWLQTSVRGFIGIFGNMSVPMPYWMYFAYFGVIGAGVVVFIISSVKEKDYGLLKITLMIAAVIPVVLSVWYSWKSDYQPQGRYLLPALPVLAVYFLFGMMGKNKEQKCSRGLMIFAALWVVMFAVVMFTTMIPFLSDPVAAEAAVTGFMK